MDVLIPFFFLISGGYLIYKYSAADTRLYYKNMYGDQLGKHKCFKGKIGGCVLIVIAALGFVLALI